MAGAQAKADVDPVLEQQINTFRTQAGEEATARVKGEQVKWMMPENEIWDGDLFDYAGMSDLFSRKFSNEKFTEATQDATKPGTVGDLIVTTLQIDYLACMDRAFRMRHTMGRTRAIVHMSARKQGHGSASGPLVQCVLEHIRGLVKKSKDGGNQ